MAVGGAEAFKVFHFQELNWRIYFPQTGNSGKYRGYIVLFKEQPSQGSRQVKLKEILDNPALEEAYPHTVGYYRVQGQDDEAKPEYLELRKIHAVEEFWLFLNALDI